MQGISIAESSLYPSVFLFISITLIRIYFYQFHAPSFFSYIYMYVYKLKYNRNKYVNSQLSVIEIYVSDGTELTATDSIGTAETDAPSAIFFREKQILMLR